LLFQVLNFAGHDARGAAKTLSSGPAKIIFLAGVVALGTGQGHPCARRWPRWTSGPGN